VTPEEFLQVTASNLKADGNVVTAVDLPSGPVTVGYKGEFRWSWFATKLNLFVVVTTRPEATAHNVSTLISEAINYAKQTKGRLRGLQTGVAVMPILASASVSPEAMDLIKSRPSRGFAAIAMPAIVDLSTDEANYYEGRLVLGAVYTKWLRERLAQALGHN
jgi:hypothetical protein